MEPAVLIVAPKFTPGTLVFQLQRENGELQLDYAMTGCNLGKLAYRPKQTVIDCLFDVKTMVDLRGSDVWSQDIQVMIKGHLVTQADWKKLLKHYFAVEEDVDSNSDMELPAYTRQPQQKAAAKTKGGFRKTKQEVLKKPAALKRPSSRRR